MPTLKKCFLLALLLMTQTVDAGLPNYCRRLQLPGWWGAGEYLLTWRKERFYPPLVTTSPPGTPLADAGILGLPTTTILFGGEHVGNSPESGLRFDGGFWLTPCFGFGATWTALGKENVDFSLEGNENGNPIFGVPLSESGVPSFFPVSFPGLLGSGKLDIHTTNNIWVADIYTRWRGCDFSCLHVDLLGGFRYSRLNDSIDINTSSTDLDPMDPLISLDTFDSFNAKNTFYSGLLGVVGEYRCGRLWLQVTGKFGFGNMLKRVDINGQTIADAFEIPDGIFVFASNRGLHTDNNFEITSEGSVRIGCYVWRNMMVTGGYQIIYWPEIFLAGEQIDTNIDQLQMEPIPRFPGRTSSFWTQSLTVGVYFLY